MHAKRIDKNSEFIYTVRGIISNEPVHYKGFEIAKELYVETSISVQPEKVSTIGMNIVKTLNITDVLNNFVVRLNLDRTHYPALSSSNPSIS